MPEPQTPDPPEMDPDELERLLGESNEEVMELRGQLANALKPKGKVPALHVFVVICDRANGHVWVANIPKDTALRIAMASDIMAGANLVLKTLT